MQSAATALPQTTASPQQIPIRQVAPQVAARPYFSAVPIEIQLQRLHTGTITQKILTFVELLTYGKPWGGHGGWRTYRAVEVSSRTMAKAIGCDHGNVSKCLKRLEALGQLWRRGWLFALSEPRSPEERQAWPVWSYRTGDLGYQRWLAQMSARGTPISTQKGEGGCEFDNGTKSQGCDFNNPPCCEEEDKEEATGREEERKEKGSNCTSAPVSKGQPLSTIKNLGQEISGPVGGVDLGAGSLDRPTIETPSKKSAPPQSIDHPTAQERELWRRWCARCGAWGVLDRTLLSYMRRLPQNALIALIRRRTPDRVGSPSALLMSRLKEALGKTERVYEIESKTPTKAQPTEPQQTSEPPGQSLKDLYPYHVALGAQTYEDVVQIYSQINALKMQGSLPDEPYCLERLASGELEPEPPGTWRGRVRVEQRDPADKSTALQSSAELDESEWEELEEHEWEELDEGSLSDAERAELEEIRAVMERSFSEGW